MRKTALIAMLFALTPALAFANPHGAGAHMRPQLFHDRAPKAHVHAPQPHHTSVPVATAVH